ncbi:MAG: efflux RND transporter periplasmic adaptor subunit [Bacteroidota bacterium]
MKRNTCSMSVVALLLYIIFISACSSKANKEENKLEKFQVTNPFLLDTAYAKEYVAEIQSVQNVEIRARVQGFIEKIYVDEGKAVSAGQVLFTLSRREFKEDLLKANAQLKSAVAELKSAEVEIKNSQLLADNNIIGKSELEMLKAKKEAIQARIEEAKSNISVANLNLSYTEVRAPFSGVLNRIPNKTGSLVEEGTLLTTISNNKEMFAYFNVSESEYLDFVKEKEANNQSKISLVLANGKPFSQTGFIETTDNEIDRGSGNLSFRARFANPQQILKHGSTAKLLMNVNLHNSLVVPQKSTFEVQDKLNVYVVDVNNVVHTKSFVPKLRLPHLFVIESGLTVEDRILYEGIQLVKDGDKITPEAKPLNLLMSDLAKQ